MKKTKKAIKKEPIHHRAKRHVKLATWPHAANQFRPHVVRWYGIVGILAVVFVAFGTSNMQMNGTVLGTKANIATVELLNDTNAERAKKNETALKFNEKLSNAAFLKAQDMFKQQYWAHTAPDGTTAWHWFANAGYNYAYAGENLAKNFATADATVAAWMASQRHKDNILNPNYTDVGFAVVDGALNNKPTTLIVALYGRPAAAVAGVATQAPAVNSDIGTITRFGVALKSMTPALLGSLIILLTSAVIALGAHAYRRRLPVSLRRSWRYHHGLYKAVGLTSVAVMLVALYSGGQI